MRDPQIDQCIGGGIVIGRCLLGGFAAHARGKKATCRAGVHEPADDTLLGRVPVAGDRRLHRGPDVAFLRHGINQTGPLRLARAFGPAGQHHCHGLDRIDQARQPHGTAKPRMQTKLHFGEAEARTVDGEPVVAGERHLEPAAKAVAMNHRNGRERQAIEAIENRVAARQQRFDLPCIGDAAKLGDIGTGDKAPWLGGADDQAARPVAFELFQDSVEFDQHLFRQGVRAGALLIEQQPDDAILVGPHSPMRPRSSVQRRFVDRKRTELEVALAQDRQGGLGGVGFAHAPPLKPLRSAWRRLGRRRYIRWRCRACSRAASWH